MRIRFLATVLFAGVVALAGGCGGNTTTGHNPPPAGGGDTDQSGGDGGGGDSAASGAPQVVITRPQDGDFLLMAGGPPPQRDLMGDITDDTAILAQNVQWTITAPDASTSTGQGTVTGTGTNVQTTFTVTFDQLGDYTVLLAYDDGTDATSDTITLHVVDNLPPVLTILRPVDNDGDGIADTRIVEGDLFTLRGRVAELDADAVDPAMVGWTVTAPDSSTTTGAGTTTCNGASTTCTSDFAYTFISAGTYQLRLEYTDAASALHTATLGLDVVPNTPPTCQILTPADGSAFADGANVNVVANVSDPDQPAGTLNVAWFVDDPAGTQAGAGQNDQLTLALGGAAPCEAHQIICVVTDDAGATGRDSVGFVANTTPTISITGVTDDLGADVLASSGSFFDTTASTAPIRVALDVNDAEDAQGAGVDMTVSVLDSHTGAVIETPALVNPAGGTAYTATWSVTGTEIGRHTLVARVADSCGSTAEAEAEVIIAPAEQTILPIPRTSTWDVRALLPLGDSLYVGYRDNGDHLALVSGLTLDPPATPTVDDVTALLAALGGGTWVRAMTTSGNDLVLATDDGLIVCPMTDPAGGDYSLAVVDLANPTECTILRQYRDANGNQIGDPQTRAILALRDGSLIAGTDSGAVWLAGGAGGAGVECVPGATILDLAYEPITGAVFGGTDGDFVFRWDPLFGDCDVTTYDQDNSPLVGADSVVPAVAVDSTGVWFGTERASLAHLAVADDSWIVHQPDNSPLVFGDPIEDIAIEVRALGSPPADRDLVWAGLDPNSALNASVLRRDEVLPSWTQFSAAQDGLPDRRVRRIIVDQNGIKWLATPNGVAGYAWP